MTSRFTLTGHSAHKQEAIKKTGQESQSFHTKGAHGLGVQQQQCMRDQKLELAFTYWFKLDLLTLTRNRER